MKMGNNIPYGNRTLTDQARAYLERLIETTLNCGYIHDRYDLSLTEIMEAFKFGAFWMMDQMRNMLHDGDAKPTPFAQYGELSKFVDQISKDIGVHRKGKLFMMMDEAERYEMLSSYMSTLEKQDGMKLAKLEWEEKMRKEAESDE